MNINKIKAYIGFAIKSKQIVFGVDSIKEKQVKVIFFSGSLSESSKITCQKIAEKCECKIYEISNDDMFEIVNSDKIKAFAVLNSDLANAINNNM